MSPEQTDTLATEESKQLTLTEEGDATGVARLLGRLTQHRDGRLRARSGPAVITVPVRPYGYDRRRSHLLSNFHFNASNQGMKAFSIYSPSVLLLWPKLV